MDRSLYLRRSKTARERRARRLALTLTLAAWAGSYVQSAAAQATQSLPPTADASGRPAPRARGAASGAPSALPQGAVSETIVVSGRQDVPDDSIVRGMGATVHTIGPDQIESMPQGEDAPFQQVLLRSPGVVQDSFGEIHVRGEHGNVQFRLNGVLLPESLNGFAQEVDTRFIHAVTLVDGSLPAQFGFRTSGIIDVVTKRGSELRGAEVGLQGGAYGTLQPSVQFGSSSGKLEYYTALSYKQSALGIESPTASPRPLHDATRQGRGFGYLAYQLDPSRRLTLLMGVTRADFQIPDTPGLAPAFALAGASSLDSLRLDDRQREDNRYALLALDLAPPTGSAQQSRLALFTRYGRIAFRPDVAGDLVFSGVASGVDESFLASGLQLDIARRAGDLHTLRAGLLATDERTTRASTSEVFAAGPGGAQLSDVPLRLADNTRLHGLLAGVYLQDEWRPRPPLTINFGLRYDRSDAFLHESQLSPRLNGVWRISDQITLHGGYARYFTPPSLQYVAPRSVALFAGTTNAPESFVDSPPKAERADYFDLGLSRRLRPGWQVSLDGFLKRARNLIDLGQFGKAVILAPFNYRTGQVHGLELATSERVGSFSAYVNAAYVFTRARAITSAQFEFPLDELAYVSRQDIRLDHEGEVSASMGAAYGRGATRGFLDLVYCSGLRRGFANLGKLPAYYPLNLGVEHTLLTAAAGVAIKLRLDLLNALDQVYRLRDGSGIGIAASQFGPRRALYAGLTVLH